VDHHTELMNPWGILDKETPDNFLPIERVSCRGRQEEIVQRRRRHVSEVAPGYCFTGTFGMTTSWFQKLYRSSVCRAKESLGRRTMSTHAGGIGIAAMNWK